MRSLGKKWLLKTLQNRRKQSANRAELLTWCSGTEFDHQTKATKFKRIYIYTKLTRCTTRNIKLSNTKRRTKHVERLHQQFPGINNYGYGPAQHQTTQWGTQSKV